MARRESLDTYDIHNNGYGEAPAVYAGVRDIPIQGFALTSPLEPQLENEDVADAINELDENNQGMLVQAQTGGIRMHVFKNRDLALKTLGFLATGITAAAAASVGIYFLNKHEGKWNLHNMPHPHIGKDK